MSSKTTLVNATAVPPVSIKQPSLADAAIMLIILYGISWAHLKVRHIIWKILVSILGLAVLGNFIRSIREVIGLSDGAAVVVGTTIGLMPFFIKKYSPLLRAAIQASQKDCTEPSTDSFSSLAYINAWMPKRILARNCFFATLLVGGVLAIGGGPVRAAICVAASIVICMPISLHLTRDKPRLMYAEKLGQNWEKALTEFESASQSNCVWLINREERISDRKRNAGAHNNVSRSLVTFSKRKLSIVESDVEPYCLGLYQAQLFFLPDRLFVFRSNVYTAFNYEDISIQAGTSQFIEEERVPGDAQVIGHSWQYVNSSGGPDKRFANNRQFPIAKYGTFSLRFLDDNVKFEFQISKIDAAKSFANAMMALKNITTTESQSSESSSNEKKQNEDACNISPYEILGISNQASESELKTAYRTLISQYHPDKVATLGPELQRLALEKTKEINWAYGQCSKRKSG